MDTKKKNQAAPDMEGIVNTEVNGMDVKILSKMALVNGAVLRGHGVLNKEKNCFEFFQTFGERKKNPIVARTLHLSFRRQKDGCIRGTVMFDPDSKFVREELIAEFRECFKKMEGKKA